ncbi:MAG: cytochrome c oxidase assembly protein [Chloroflexota bacterium]|nr:cytochrome c oxidase assembly protein [Chloroflexota bacterium]
MLRPVGRRSRLTAALVAGSIAGAVTAPPPVLAHGAPPAPPSTLDVLLAWRFEPHVVLPLLGLLLLYRLAARRVARRHPGNPVPRWREWSWYGGLGVLLVALASPIATYDTTFFAAHMVQHLLLTMVAAPLLALAAPITLLLRVATPRTRQRVILPVLHSLPLRIASFPIVTWLVFAAVMWTSHFSPLYEAALHDELVHVAEHALYLGAAMLFWWPAVGADPSPWRLPHAARIAYLFLGMPQSSFLGLAMLSSPNVLYPHYATLERSWGPGPLADQQLAGGIMWAGGDLAFLVALILAVWVWLRAEEAEGRRVDARLDRERAARRRAEQAVAEHAVRDQAVAEQAVDEHGVAAQHVRERA